MPQLRCDHHHVCWMLRFRNKCKNDGQPKPVCMFDTRLHSNVSERDKVMADYLKPLKEGDVIIFDQHQSITETTGIINWIGEKDKSKIGVEACHYRGFRGGMTGSTDFALPLKKVRLVQRWIPVAELRAEAKDGEP